MQSLDTSQAEKLAFLVFMDEDWRAKNWYKSTDFIDRSFGSQNSRQHFLESLNFFIFTGKSF